MKIPFEKNNCEPIVQNSTEPFAVLSDIDWDEVSFLRDDVPEEVVPKQKRICTDDTLSEIEVVLDSYNDLFSGIGKTDLVTHHIQTTDDVPINFIYHLPVHLKDKAADIISEMLQNGIISHSESEFSSPIVLVKKRNSDQIRVTIDYRALNAKSKKDAFATPRADDLIDELHGAKVFSKIDVKSAYHNIMRATEDRHKTAFRFNGELYEYNRVPFGLSSAPGTFNRLISKILLGLDKYCAVFFDDIWIFSQNVTDHVKQVLSAIFTAGLKLNREKCIFLVDTVEFLGYTITQNKVTVSESKIKTIKDYPVPKSIKDIKKFLGLAGFYRKLLPNFSELVAPLSVMQCKNVTYSDCQKCFDEVISLFCSSPIVAMPNPELPYIVKVDSSKFGVGCILEQEDPCSNQRHVIAYSSKKYNTAQQNYPAIELEVCGLIFAIKHWKCYPIVKPFIVETDSKSFQWIKAREIV